MRVFLIAALVAVVALAVCIVGSLEERSFGEETVIEVCLDAEHVACETCIETVAHTNHSENCACTCAKIVETTAAPSETRCPLKLPRLVGAFLYERLYAKVSDTKVGVYAVGVRA